MGRDPLEWESIEMWVGMLVSTVRGQKDSSDGGFRAKFTIFNRTIPNTVWMDTLQNFPPARES